MHLIPEHRPGRGGRPSGSCTTLLNRSRLESLLNINFEVIVVILRARLVSRVVLRVLARILSICLVYYHHELISSVFFFTSFRQVAVLALGSALRALPLTFLLFLPLRYGELELLAGHLLLGSALLQGVEDVLHITLLAHVQQRLGQRTRSEHVY